MNTPRSIGDAELETLQRETFDYFVYEANPANGLIMDRSQPDWPASIAATGLALAAYPVGVERGFWTRRAAVERTLVTLRFFWNSPQGTRGRRDGTSGVLLSLPRPRDRPARLAVRIIDRRQRVPAGRRARRRRLLRRRCCAGAGDSRSRRGALSPMQLGVGAKWPGHADAWLAAGERVHRLSLGRL